MELEILTKAEIEQLIKNYYEPPLMGRVEISRELGMTPKAFDKFIANYPHLKHKKPHTAAKYCPKECKDFIKGLN